MATQVELVKNPGVDIDSLDMSAGMKAKMHLVQEHFVKETLLFGPQYDLKGTKHWKIINIWAFIFNFIYYFVKGMWRKGLVLLLINIIINVISVVIDEIYHLNIISLGLGPLLIACISMESAYYDIYRDKVLKQKFWW